MVGSDLARIWDGSGVDLGWICEDLGLDLRGSWAGSSVVAVEISAKKCKKNVKICKNYCICEKKIVPLQRIWE